MTEVIQKRFAYPRDVNVPIYPIFVFLKKNGDLFANPQENTNHIHLDKVINDLNYYSTHNQFRVNENVYTDILLMIYHQIMLLTDENKYDPIIVIIKEGKLRPYIPRSPIMITKHIYECLNNKKSQAKKF